MAGRSTNSGTTREDESIRSLVPTIYLPGLLFAIGLGAVVPQIALTARSLGASVAVAGLAVALQGLGKLVFDVPSGIIVSRLGQRRAMLFATGVLVVSLTGCVMSDSVWVFASWMFVHGCGWSVWSLAKLAYISEAMPSYQRGRALSTMGGVQRIGTFVGPFIGAGAVALVGFDGAYIVHLTSALIAGGVLYFVPDPFSRTSRQERRQSPDLLGIGRRHARVFLTGGVGILTLGALRASRQVILPLWAEFLGLDAVVVGIVFGISSAIDMTLFYPAGSISDRFGRKAVAVPCMAILALGLMLLPLTTGLWGLIAIGALLGLGNGLGSGIVMTLGADFSPDEERAPFLGVWQLVGSVGSTAGPLAASIIAGISLAAAPLTMGVMGFAGAALLLLKMPEPRQLQKKATANDASRRPPSA